MKNLPLHTFPLIEDFEVVLERMETFSGGKNGMRDPFGYHIRFFSPPRGYIAGFPWWDHAEQDLRRKDFSIPLGTIDQPFWDLEQGWDIAIGNDAHFVYVVEGDLHMNEREHRLHTWFKVSQDRYSSQWQKAIQTCHHFNNRR